MSKWSKIKRWLNKNVFWILSALILELGMYAVAEDNILACLAFLILFVIVLVIGVHYTNVEFTKEVLNEYDRMVNIQKARKFKILPGGKKK